MDSPNSVSKGEVGISALSKTLKHQRCLFMFLKQRRFHLKILYALEEFQKNLL